jgi:type I restriction enzyme M protein
MSNGDLNWIANFIWGIADDVLRDLYVRGKYRDVILPMTVLRRLDALLEPTKQAVLDMKASLDKAKIVHQDQALRQAAGQAFYNTSKFTLRDLKARSSQQQLKADFEAYLDGFSPNVQDILDKFEFRNQIPRLSKSDTLGTLINKFLSPDINLSPNPVRNNDGSVKHPGLDNHAMGTIFEELVRRFNEENNEEAGEHWTPRDAVKLMAKLIFLPIADQIQSGTYLLYDGACGTGGMLTVAEETLQQLASEHKKKVATHLYGQEINAETYAIAKADLLLKGEGEAADNIVGGPEHSTLSNDAFPSREFDFMLSNPPYGKSWKSDLERMGGKEGIKDPRFVIQHAGDGEYSLITRSSDGQILFLANMLSKMKHKTKLGSRIAECTTARPSLPETPARARATSAAGSLSTIGSKPSSPCRAICSITPALPPTSGCSPIGNPTIARGRFNSLMRRSGSNRPARTSARRIANCQTTTSSVSATPSSSLRRQNSRRYFPMRRSAIGK